MATYIERGDSLFIPFKKGKSISDSQCKPRMYKSVQNFEKTFPKHNNDTTNIELVEYVEIVRCEKCKHKIDYCGRLMCGRLKYDFKDGVGGLVATVPEHFCSYGERKDT